MENRFTLSEWSGAVATLPICHGAGLVVERLAGWSALRYRLLRAQQRIVQKPLVQGLLDRR